MPKPTAGVRFVGCAAALARREARRAEPCRACWNSRRICAASRVQLLGTLDFLVPMDAGGRRRQELMLHGCVVTGLRAQFRQDSLPCASFFHVLQIALAPPFTCTLQRSARVAYIRTLAGSHAPMLASGSHVRFRTYFGTHGAGASLSPLVSRSVSRDVARDPRTGLWDYFQILKIICHT